MTRTSVSVNDNFENQLKDNCKCSCGKNGKSTKDHCIEIASKYTTMIKCNCLKSNKGCSSSCYCKNCNNPFGKRSSVEAPPQKRNKHEWQKYPHTSSYQYAIDKGEEVFSGPLTMVEFFIFDILDYCEEEGIEQTAASIIQICNQVLQSVCNCETVLPVSYKTTEQAKAFLKMHLKLLDTFDVLCKNQFDCNNCQELLD